MNFKIYLQSYFFRYAFSVGFAVFIAVLVSYYFNKSGWMLLSAFLVSQASRGTPLRQGALFCIFMMAAIFICSFLAPITQQLSVMYSVMLIFIISSYFVFLNQPLQNKTFFRVMLFPFVLLMAVLFPVEAATLLRDQMIDVIVGALIGMLCSQFILPARFDKEFSQGLIPVLKAADQYLRVVTNYFLRREFDADELVKKKMQMEKMLQIQYGGYPEWVYEVGFNPGLRSGFRFYLINIERMVEMLFSMEYLANRGVDFELLQKTSDCIFSSMQKNAELMSILIEYFENKKLKDLSSDFTKDISDLEKAVNQATPGYLELLDISPDYVILTAFARNIKDLRKLLLQLVMALPPLLKQETGSGLSP